MPFFSVLFSVFIGCSAGKDSADTAPLTCEGSWAPSIVDIYCENSGLMIYPETGENTPTMTVWADVEDEDADLMAYTAELFFDDVIDGTVSTTNSLGLVEGYVNDDYCDVPSIILGTTVFLRGGQPLYETSYEWGLVVTDANGNTSDMAMVTCKTPDASGQGATSE